jgi:transcription elongation factor Elf1
MMTARRPRLAPCPFCGHPQPVLRAVPRSGAVTGYEATCGPCMARIYAPWSPPATKVSVQRALTALWNTRPDVGPDPNAEGFRGCPLCGGADVTACAVEFRYVNTYLADAVRCPSCGLRIIPRWRDYYYGRPPTSADVRNAWNVRQTTADWRLLHECAPIEPINPTLTITEDELDRMTDEWDWRPDDF